MNRPMTVNAVDFIDKHSTTVSWIFVLISIALLFYFLLNIRKILEIPPISERRTPWDTYYGQTNLPNHIYQSWRKRRLGKKVYNKSKEFLKNLGIESRITICYAAFDTYVYVDIPEQTIVDMLRAYILTIDRGIETWKFKIVPKDNKVFLRKS